MARNCERRLATSAAVRPAERRRSKPCGGCGDGSCCCVLGGESLPVEGPAPSPPPAAVAKLLEVLGGFGLYLAGCGPKSAVSKVGCSASRLARAAAGSLASSARERMSPKVAWM